MFCFIVVIIVIIILIIKRIIVVRNIYIYLVRYMTWKINLFKSMNIIKKHKDIPSQFSFPHGLFHTFHNLFWVHITISKKSTRLPHTTINSNDISCNI